MGELKDCAAPSTSTRSHLNFQTRTQVSIVVSANQHDRFSVCRQLSYRDQVGAQTRTERAARNHERDVVARGRKGSLDTTPSFLWIGSGGRGNGAPRSSAGSVQMGRASASHEPRCHAAAVEVESSGAARQNPHGHHGQLR